MQQLAELASTHWPGGGRARPSDAKGCSPACQAAGSSCSSRKQFSAATLGALFGKVANCALHHAQRTSLPLDKSTGNADFFCSNGCLWFQLRAFK